MTGTTRKLIADKAFGFVRGEDGKDRFSIAAPRPASIT
jgi:hypothetical protein